MPTYEYRCTECDTALEVVQSIHEPALTECPTCGGRLRKVFGNVGVVFKGSGFYRTDSRGKKAATTSDKPAEKSGDTVGTGAGAKAAKAAKADGAGSATTEAKPAASSGSSSSTPASSPAPTGS
jgi:putative FmdB family regulatory protein